MTPPTASHAVVTTVKERYYFDPEMLRERFQVELAAFMDQDPGAPFEDFVISLFELHEGSQFCEEFFWNDASPIVFSEVVRADG